jgi:hypothetical protein
MYTEEKERERKKGESGKIFSSSSFVNKQQV